MAATLRAVARAGMKYNPTSGLWVDSAGRRFLRNEFLPRSPTFIRITSGKWQATHLYKDYSLVWPDGLSKNLKKQLEAHLMLLMRRRAPSLLHQYNLVLYHICKSHPELSPLSVAKLLNPENLRRLWVDLGPSYRPHFRTLFCDILTNSDPKKGAELAIILRSWKSNRSLTTGSSVKNWEPRSGAMVSSELEVLRQFLLPQKNEPIIHHFARLFIRISLNTLRRPSQIICIAADGLRRHKSRFGVTAEVLIPLRKGQAQCAARWEQIPLDLADDIDAYRARPEIASASVTQEVLLPYIAIKKGKYIVKTTYGAIIKLSIQSWVSEKGIVSPRTGEPLSLTLRRIRHSGATHMAMQGYSLQLIADMLQHDYAESARYYIDSVGTEFIPVFEKLNGNLGGRLSALQDSWFRGKIVNRSHSIKKPIIVPKVDAPAVVGACGNKNSCSVHPLFNCYSCQHFLAFREADHGKVLDYLRGEYEHWRSAEPASYASKVAKDFDRAAVGVRQVLSQLSEEERNK